MRLAYIMIKSKNRSVVQSHIDKLTQLSKQILRHRKLAQSQMTTIKTSSAVPSNKSSNTNATATFFTEEIQLFITSSCRLITGNFFKKWVDYALDQGRRVKQREKAIAQIVGGLQRHIRAQQFEAVLKLHKYKEMVQRNAGTVKQRTMLSFKLSQMKVALTLVHLIQKKSIKKALLRSFKHWSLHSSNHNLILKLKGESNFL